MRNLSLLLALALLALASTASAAIADTVVVKDGDVARQAENTPPTRNWVIYTRAAGSAVFEPGPAWPPRGVGSLQLTTPTGADKVYAFNYDHVGTSLADIDAMRYATYRESGASPNQVPALNIEVDYNGAAAGGYTVLVFEPVYNTTQGTVEDGEWQPWNAYAGGNAVWWSSRSIPGVCAFDCFVTWNTIVANNPDAVIGGGFGVNQGSGNPALVANTDALSIGVDGDVTTYDFEPTLTPGTKDGCKKGGWQTFNTPKFKNQGDCVSYAAKGRRD
jgi:hypothetical protein